jgi:hypothetical protein
MAIKLIMTAAKTWRRLKGDQLLLKKEPILCCVS